jgi:hypothetical protein
MLCIGETPVNKEEKQDSEKRRAPVARRIEAETLHTAGARVRGRGILQPASVNTDAGIYGLYGSRGDATKEHFREVGSKELGDTEDKPSRWPEYGPAGDAGL